MIRLNKNILVIDMLPKLQEKYDQDISRYALVVLSVSILHHLFFCFINTNIATISSAPLVLTELIVISGIFIFFLRQIDFTLLALIVFIISNSLILVIFQSYFDPKEIRNFVSPILLLWLGTKYNQKIPVDTVVYRIGLMVLLFGVVELLLPDFFQQLFNVLKFQIATGRSTEEALKFVTTSLSLNGVRWGGRNFLSFLGDHRISSVFLETVNMGNFSVLIACWGLSKSHLRQAYVFVGIGIICALLADSRFAVTLIIAMASLRYISPIQALRVISYFMPLIILLICFIVAEDQRAISDDFKGRLGSTGYFILHFKLPEFFGLYNKHYSLFVDQGYAHILHFNGLILPAVMWLSLCFLKMQDDTGVRFKAMISIVIASSLAISGDSVFSFKWSALMWFLVGTLSSRSVFKTAIKPPISK